MSVNLIDSTNIEVIQSGNDISLDFASGGQVEENTTHIGNLSNLNTTDKSSLVGAINEINKSMIYSAWSNSISFELSIGRQALVLVNSDTNAVLFLWNPSDRLNSSAIFGDISAFNITRNSNETTITVTRTSGNATWTVLVLE